MSIEVIELLVLLFIVSVYSRPTAGRNTLRFREKLRVLTASRSYLRHHGGGSRKSTLYKQDMTVYLRNEYILGLLDNIDDDNMNVEGSMVLILPNVRERDSFIRFASNTHCKGCHICHQDCYRHKGSQCFAAFATQRSGKGAHTKDLPT